jgi:MFS family permease
MSVLHSNKDLIHPEKVEEDDNAIDENSTVDSSSQQGLSNWLFLFTVYNTVISDSIALNVVTPFIEEITQIRFGISKQDGPIYAGILQGIFSLAVFLSSSFIGYLSDIYGRRPFILLGLFTNSICSILFPLSESYALALFLRFFSGFTNSNIALCKAIISDTITNGTERALAFAYQGAAFQGARAVTSALSGFTYGVIICNYDNPFFLPCLIGGTLNLVTLIEAYFFIPETLRKGAIIHNSTQHADDGTDDQLDDLQNDFMNEADVHAENSVIQSTCTFEYVAAVIASFPQRLKQWWIDLGKLMEDVLLCKLLLMTGANSFGNSGILIIIALFCPLDIDVGGLGATPSQTGIVYAIFGTVGLCFQLLFFKQIHHQFGLVGTYLRGNICMFVAITLLPISAILLRTNTSFLGQIIAYAWVAFSIGFCAIGFVTCLPVLGTMLANVSNPKTSGMNQGTAQSIASFLRGLGPIVTGSMLSISVAAFSSPYLVFIFLGIANLINIYVCLSLSNIQISAIESPLLSSSASCENDDEVHVQFNGGDEEESVKGHSGDTRFKLQTSTKKTTAISISYFGKTEFCLQK